MLQGVSGLLCNDFREETIAVSPEGLELAVQGNLLRRVPVSESETVQSTIAFVEVHVVAGIESQEFSTLKGVGQPDAVSCIENALFVFAHNDGNLQVAKLVSVTNELALSVGVHFNTAGVISRPLRNRRLRRLAGLRRLGRLSRRTGNGATSKRLVTTCGLHRSCQIVAVVKQTCYARSVPSRLLTIASNANQCTSAGDVEEIAICGKAVVTGTGASRVARKNGSIVVIHGAADAVKAFAGNVGVLPAVIGVQLVPGAARGGVIIGKAVRRCVGGRGGESSGADPKEAAHNQEQCDQRFFHVSQPFCVKINLQNHVSSTNSQKVS